MVQEIGFRIEIRIPVYLLSSDSYFMAVLFLLLPIHQEVIADVIYCDMIWDGFEN